MQEPVQCDRNNCAVMVFEGKMRRVSGELSDCTVGDRDLCVYVCRPQEGGLLLSFHLFLKKSILN